MMEGFWEFHIWSAWPQFFIGTSAFYTFFLNLHYEIHIGGSFKGLVGTLMMSSVVPVRGNEVTVVIVHGSLTI